MTDQGDTLDIFIFRIDFVDQLVAVACWREMVGGNDHPFAQFKYLGQNLRRLCRPQIWAGQDQADLCVQFL